VTVEAGRQAEVRQALSALGFRVVRTFNTYMSVEAPPDVTEKIMAVPGVVSVEPERVYKPLAFVELPVEKQMMEFIRMGGPLNPLAMAYVAAQGLRKDRWPTSESRKALGADVADKMGISGKGVTVGVCDSGWDYLGNPQKPRVDFMESTMEGDPNPLDSNGHGSHVLTTIAGGRLPTPWGPLEGVAKGVGIGAVKVLGYLVGSGRTLDVMEGIATAIYNGAKVINMSLGATVEPGEHHDPSACPLCRFIEDLAARGYIFCVAAGNDGVGHASCPGLSRGAITVAALDKGLRRADFSSCKHPDYLALRKPDLGAPGVNIGSTTTGLIAAMNWYEGPKVSFISGTSMATPHASSLMALWAEYARRRGVELTRDVVMDILRTYSTWDAEVGYGCPKFEWAVDYFK
jgi:subtilisin family serine protease